VVEDHSTFIPPPPLCPPLFSRSPSSFPLSFLSRFFPVGKCLEALDVFFFGYCVFFAANQSKGFFPEFPGVLHFSDFIFSSSLN